MDICTLVIASTMDAAIVSFPTVCHPSKDDTKQFCAGGDLVPCQQPTSMYYDCKRPDGTSYMIYVLTANQEK